jgi:triacylglycerol lipase
VQVEPRPLPTETIDGLRPPRPQFPYFAGADRFAFEAAAPQYSAVNAWWQADACFLVYGSSAFIEEAIRQSPLARQSWRLDWLGTPEENRGIVLSNKDVLVMVFRGTRLESHSPFDASELVVINQDDLWTDSQFLPAVCESGGRVHSGFLKAFAQVSDCLDTVLQERRPDQRLYLTGHSLGGALATLAAAHLGPARVDGLYTYGSPRVGDATFAAALSVERHFRFVFGEDWVSTVPPEILGYVHTGTLRRVPGGPTRKLWDDLVTATGDFVAAITEMARQLRLDMGELPFRIAGLVDHAPIYYATLLWNALLDEQDIS